MKAEFKKEGAVKYRTLFLVGELFFNVRKFENLIIF